MNFRKVILCMDENVVILIRSPVCHLRNEFSRVVSNLIMFTSNESYLPFDLTRFRFFRIFLLFWHLSTGLIGYLMAPPFASRLLWAIMLHGMHTQRDGILPSERYARFFLIRFTWLQRVEKKKEIHWKINKNKFRSLLRNIRPIRSLFFFSFRCRLNFFSTVFRPSCFAVFTAVNQMDFFFPPNTTTATQYLQISTSCRLHVKEVYKVHTFRGASEKKIVRILADKRINSSWLTL